MKHSTPVASRLIASFALLVASDSLSAIREPFKCPADLKYKSAILFDKTIKLESCVDSMNRKQGPARWTRLPSGVLDGEAEYVDGQKHGPEKGYDPDGDLVGVTIYERGVETTFYMPTASLRKEFERQNRTLKERGVPSRIKIGPDRRAVYEYDFGPSGITNLKNFESEKVLQPALLNEMCNLAKENFLSGIDFQVRNKSNAVLKKFSLDMALCGQAASTTKKNEEQK